MPLWLVYAPVIQDPRFLLLFESISGQVRSSFPFLLRLGHKSLGFVGSFAEVAFLSSLRQDIQALSLAFQRRKPWRKHFFLASVSQTGLKGVRKLGIGACFWVRPLGGLGVKFLMEMSY